MLSVFAIVVLWIRRRSVLDLWLMVVMFLYAIEVPLSYYPDPIRFSVGWYAVRVFGFLSSSLVLMVLLYEIPTLYARLLGAVLAQRREREARLMTGDAVAASIAHEVRQPLTAMVTTADAGLRFLDRSIPNLDKAKEAFKRIVADGHRAGEVVGSIRANFKSDVRDRTAFDLNELIQEALALGRGDLQKHRIVVQAEPNRQLPEVRGNRVQLQQVLLNLIMNAIDAMAAKDEPRILSVKSEAHEGDRVMVSVADTGTGIGSQDVDRMFNPLFTTKSDGMGMGLSICRAIIEAHEGRLWFAPNTPRGAVFHFTLQAANRLRRADRAASSIIFANAGSGSSVFRECPAIRTSSASDRGSHLLHDLAAMNLERDLADAQLGRSLLVEKAAYDQRQHLALAWRQGRKALMQIGQLRSLPPGVAILREGSIDRAHQVCLPERLGQKVDRACLDRAHGRGNVSMSGDEHDRAGDRPARSGFEDPVR